MIPIEKKAMIHEMLLAGSAQKIVAIMTGVSASTVARIARANRLADCVSPAKRKRARTYLISGLSPDAVAAHLGMSRETVLAIRGTEFLLSSVVEAPHPCPTCGLVMLPQEDGDEHYSSQAPSLIRIEHARALFSLADDVVGLAKSYTVRNMLFYDIADKMEKLLTDITGEDHAKEKARN